MEVDIFSVKGEKKGKASLPKEFVEKRSFSALSQALRVYESNLHSKPAKRRTRSEVELTKRKVYRQKGTGNARHGAKSAPIFVGGGLAHGPKGIKRFLKLPKAIRRQALFSALNAKLEDKKLVFAENLTGIKKTKEGEALIKKLLVEVKLPRQGILLVLPSKINGAGQGFKNLAGVKILTKTGLNAFEVFKSNFVILDTAVFGLKEIKTKKEDKKND